MISRNKMYARRLKTIALTFVLISAGACDGNHLRNAVGSNIKPEAGEASVLSYGMVKKIIENGKTTQAEIVKYFGAPNNMTYTANGDEMWVYDHVRTETTTSASRTGGGIIIGGLVGPVAAGVGGSNAASSGSHISMTRTLTVIIEFNRAGIVQSHSARVGGY